MNFTTTFGTQPQGAGSNQIPDRKLGFERLPIAHLRALANHPRKLRRRHVARIARSIETLGWINAIIVDEQNAVIAGYGRWEAAKFLGLDEVPVVRANGMTDVDKRAYRISENKLAEIGEWDVDALTSEFSLLLDCSFDVELTGFEMIEIDALFEVEEEGDGAFPPQLPNQPAVSRHGDMWHIGPHRLLCGDATNSDDYEKLLGGEQAGMVFTDPPYNVPIVGNVAGLRKPKHHEFKMASGEMSEAEYRAFLTAVFDRMAKVSRPGTILYACIDWRHIVELQTAAVEAGLEVKQLCVWNKTNAGMGTFYRSQHELVFVFKKAGEHINNFGLGGKGRLRSNVWTYPGANGYRPGRSEDLDLHPTVKPVKMVVDAIMDCSKRGDIILDPFIGSGTTLLAAARTGRRGYGLEIDPRYVDTAVVRLSNELDVRATLSTGETFPEVALERLNGGKK